MPEILANLISPREPVGRLAYLRAGLILLAFKYAVDAAVFALVVGGWWHPLDYLNPLYAQRMASAPAAGSLPGWYVVFLLLWGLAFAWLGTIWSTRRAADAGLSPWWSLLFFVPFCNYLLILTLLCWPPHAHDSAVAQRPSPPDSARPVAAVVLAGLAFLALMVGLYALMVEASASYGMTVFVALPVAYGFVIGYVLNRPQPRSVSATLGFALLSAVVACLALLLFALEGAICIAMAFPIVLAAILTGALLGRALAPVPIVQRAAPLCVVLALPPAAWLDTRLAALPARAVVTSVEIDAPPSAVWQHVVSFSELPEPDDWLFRTGVAYPMRARIDGSGVGAVRSCEFSTGPFVEPITVWDEPRHLAFDVVAQPVPMQEWSFYDDLRPPHLTSTFRSVRGAFRLTPLEGGRTRLEGTTWYELDMAPEAYWRLWADAVIHRIHGRVLRHVKALAESP